MYTDKLQKQRFELKYLIHEHKAQSIRHFIKNYLKLDEYGATQPNLSYPIHSLYLDSPQYKTYHDTINGNRNRYKLRIRYYENAGASKTAFLEMKRRHDQVIVKKRAKVPIAALEELVYGPLPAKEQFPELTVDQFKELFHICQLIREIQAEPKMHVQYYREAYELENSNDVRVTFDRDVTIEKQGDLNLKLKQDSPVPVFGSIVILEIKFTNRYPNWLNELTQHFHLRRLSAAKYVDGINRIKRKMIA